MGECAFEENLGRFLIRLAVDRQLRLDYDADREEVLNREEFNLSEEDKQVLRSDDPGVVRVRLDNIQIQA